MNEILVKSTYDGSCEPSLFSPARGKKRPLLVGLHTWSFDRYNQQEELLPFAQKHDFALLLPEFRGPNKPGNPRCREACGAEPAKRDITDAVGYVKSNYDIDPANIFLLGASGGGHMALLMAAYAPDLWRAVASFVPVTSLENWYYEKNGNPVGGKYAVDIAACCGGAPSKNTAKEYAFRSPITYMEQIARSNTTIFAGKYDTSIPCRHSFDLYERIFRDFPQASVYLTIFNGGHEMRLDLAEEWFFSEMNKKETKGVSG